jgi:hypothetical protein
MPYAPSYDCCYPMIIARLVTWVDDNYVGHIISQSIVYYYNYYILFMGDGKLSHVSIPLIHPT